MRLKSLLTMTLCAILLVSSLSLPACAEEAHPLTLIALNVGKADCLLLRSGSSCYMIDTGTAESWGAVSASLRQYGITHLNGVILTHPHKDHAGGIMALAQSDVMIDGWYTSAYFVDVKKKKHPAVLAAALRGEEVTFLKGGDSLLLDGGTLTVLGPISENEKENCNSLVLLAETADGSILLAGDMEFPEEAELMGAGLISPVDVLKVGNHAEKDATSDDFAAAVRPKVAVISTDSLTEPDTPAKRVLKALKNEGAQIALTQTAEAAVEVTLSAGTPTVTLAKRMELPTAVQGIRIAGKDVQNDTITLRNEGTETVDLSGWFIRSERGRELFVFPDGASVAPGASVTVVALDSPVVGDYLWREEKVWHQTKDDQACLYDAYGRVMDEME